MTASEEAAMLLYLVQHAEARPESEDPERHLSEAGWAAVRRVARFLGQAGVRVPLILHSGRTRARETAEALAEALSPREGVREADLLDPLADPAPWAEQAGQRQEDLMLVGHLPHLSRLAALLVCGSPEREVVRFRMGGVVCLERREGRWAVAWMVIPELL